MFGSTNSTNMFQGLQNKSLFASGNTAGNSANAPGVNNNPNPSTGNHLFGMNGGQSVSKNIFALGTNSGNTMNSASGANQGGLFGGLSNNMKNPGNQNTMTTNFSTGNQNANPNQNIFGGGNLFNSNTGGTNMNSSSGLFPKSQNGGIFNNNASGVNSNNNILSTPTKSNTTNFLSQNPSNLTFAPGNNQNGGNIFQNQGNQNALNNNSMNLTNNPNNQQVQQKGSFNFSFGPIPFQEASQEPNKVANQMKGYTMTFNQHLSTKSVEEIRYEDIQLKKSGAVPPQTNTIGGMNNGGMFNQNSNTNNGSSNLFSNNSNSNNLLNKPNTNTGIGFSNAQPTNTGGLFGNTNITNTNTAPTNMGGLFSNTNTNTNTSSNNTGGLFSNNNTNSNTAPTNMGGLFSNTNTKTSAPSSTTGGLWGSNNNTNANASSTNTGGLFSNPNTNAQPTNIGGLFSNTNTNPNTNAQLFSNTNNPNTNAQPTNTGGLFSNTNNPNTNAQPTNTGGLFSNTNNPNTNAQPTNTGGLFSNSNINTNTNPQPTNTGGLFTNFNNNTSNSTSSNTGGLSNNILNMNKTSFSSGGLFNNLSSTNPNTGATSNKPTTNANTNSLFSGNTATATSGGLFSNSGENKGTSSQGGLFSNMGTLSNPTPGNTNSTSNPTNHPQSVFAPSNILGVDISSLSSNVHNAVINSKKLEDFLREFEDDYGYTSSNKYSRSYSKFEKSEVSAIEEYHRRYDSISKVTPLKTYPSEKKSDFDYYSTMFYSYPKKSSNLQFQFRDDKYYMNLLHNKRSMQSSCLSSEGRSTFPLSHSKEKSTDDFDFNRSIIELSKRSVFEKYRKKQRINQEEIKFTLENKDENKVEEESNGQDKIVLITIDITNEDVSFKMNINKNNTVLLLKEYIVEKLKAESKRFKKIRIENLVVIKSSSLMKDNKQISDYEVKNNDKLTVTISGLDNLAKKKDLSVGCNLKETMGHNLNNLAPIELVPKLTKSGYFTHPDFRVICRMTTEQLKNVKNFEIFNENGKISWKENVDLTGLDLDDIVDIRELMVTLYKGKAPLPEKGDALNKPFLISLKIYPDDKIDLNDEIEKEDFIDSLKGGVKKMGGKFLDYDVEKNELVFYCKEIKS